MKIKSIIIALSIFSVSFMSAQNQVSLTDLGKTKEYLALTETQFKVVKQMVDKINSILEEDKKIIAEIKKRVENDDEPGFFEKIGVKRGRGSRIDKIDDLLDEIENQLNDEQKTKYKSLKKPELKALNKEEIFGK